MISYTIEKIGKSTAIWGYYPTNKLKPLVYLRKPKQLSEEGWQKVLESIYLNLPFNCSTGLYPEEETGENNLKVRGIV